MRVVNLTPHAINVIDRDGKMRKAFEPSGHVARVVRTFDTHGYIEELDIDIEVLKPINILNLDGAVIEPYTIYIVSWLFLQALKEQNHPQLHQFVAPNTENAKKDIHGNIRGVYEFLVL